MRRAGRSGYGLLLAVIMIAGSTAPAWGETQPMTAAPGEGVTSTPGAAAPTAPAAAPTESMFARDPNAGVSADANAVDWATRDPARYPRLDVPTKPWAYDTSYFFALTRGLDEEGLPTWCQRASMVGTVPIDVVGLPAAALSGLFGS
jgi:hypothetical protein